MGEINYNAFKQSISENMECINKTSIAEGIKYVFEDIDTIVLYKNDEAFNYEDFEKIAKKRIKEPMGNGVKIAYEESLSLAKKMNSEIAK